MTVNGIQVLYVTPKVYKYYITKVKGNEKTDIYTCRKKLTRNIMLGKELPHTNMATYRYL
jgi:hypothetical protein